VAYDSEGVIRGGTVLCVGQKKWGITVGVSARTGVGLICGQQEES